MTLHSQGRGTNGPTSTAFFFFFCKIFSPHSFCPLFTARLVLWTRCDLCSPVTQPIHSSNTAACCKCLRRARGVVQPCRWWKSKMRSDHPSCYSPGHSNLEQKCNCLIFPSIPLKQAPRASGPLKNASVQSPNVNFQSAFNGNFLPFISDRPYQEICD